ncbi:hypothetical protein C7U62_02575 [Mesorhizobium loti]|nr:hypothetical protein C7U62_02575 [Mesorhizobium loti]
MWRFRVQGRDNFLQQLEDLWHQIGFDGLQFCCTHRRVAIQVRKQQARAEATVRPRACAGRTRQHTAMAGIAPAHLPVLTLWLVGCFIATGS